MSSLIVYYGYIDPYACLVYYATIIITVFLLPSLYCLLGYLATLHLPITLISSLFYMSKQSSILIGVSQPSMATYIVSFNIRLIIFNRIDSIKLIVSQTWPYQYEA